MQIHDQAKNTIMTLFLKKGEYQDGRPRTFDFNGIGRQFRLGDIDDAVDIERDLLGVGAPVLVAEAVGVFAIAMGGKGVVAVGHASFLYLVIAGRIGDLN